MCDYFGQKLAEPALEAARTMGRLEEMVRSVKCPRERRMAREVLERSGNSRALAIFNEVEATLHLLPGWLPVPPMGVTE